MKRSLVIGLLILTLGATPIVTADDCNAPELICKAAGNQDGPVPFHTVINGNPYASSCFRANPAYPYEHYEQLTRDEEDGGR